MGNLSATAHARLSFLVGNKNYAFVTADRLCIHVSSLLAAKISLSVDQCRQEYGPYQLNLELVVGLDILYRNDHGLYSCFRLVSYPGSRVGFWSYFLVHI